MHTSTYRRLICWTVMTSYIVFMFRQVEISKSLLLGEQEINKLLKPSILPWLCILNNFENWVRYASINLSIITLFCWGTVEASSTLSSLWLLLKNMKDTCRDKMHRKAEQEQDEDKDFMSLFLQCFWSLNRLSIYILLGIYNISIWRFPQKPSRLFQRHETRCKASLLQINFVKIYVVNTFVNEAFVRCGGPSHNGTIRLEGHFFNISHLAERTPVCFHYKWAFS